jgi:Protein of unknown function (DUF1810)
MKADVRKFRFLAGSVKRYKVHVADRDEQVGCHSRRCYEQQLNSPQILRAPIYESRLRSPHRVRAVVCWVESELRAQLNGAPLRHRLRPRSGGLLAASRPRTTASGVHRTRPRLRGKSALEILGGSDDRKFCSSMTLFDVVSEERLFGRALVSFFGGERGEKTLELLRGR